VADFDDARRIVVSLPTATQHGAQFRVNGKLFAWSYQERVPGHRSRVPRPDILAVRVADEGEKRALIAEDPGKFFTTDHYNGYPAVLVRLPVIDSQELTELLTDAWRTRAPRRLVTDFEADLRAREAP
jgi:hypothetical protein